MDFDMHEDPSRMPIGRVAQVGLLALVVVLVMIVIFWRPGKKDETQVASETKSTSEPARPATTQRPLVSTTTPPPGTRRTVPMRRVAPRPQPVATATTRPAAQQPATAPVAASRAPEPRKVIHHIVTDEDTLYRIAKKYYGDGRAWRQIAKANKLADPDRVPLGTRLVIPAVGQVREALPRPAATRAPAVRELPAGSKTHRVRSGDSYIRLAVRYYGSQQGWRKIMQANGFPESGLPVGKQIVIPAR